MNQAYLEEQIYQFIESPSFQGYYRRAILGEEVRVMQAPQLVVKYANHPNQVYEVMLTHDQKSVRVTHLTDYNQEEIGFFPIAKNGQVPSKPKATPKRKSTTTTKASTKTTTKAAKKVTE